MSAGAIRRRNISAAIEPVEQRLLMARLTFMPYIDSNSNQQRDGNLRSENVVTNEAFAYYGRTYGVSFWVDLNHDNYKQTTEPYADYVDNGPNMIPGQKVDLPAGSYTIAWAPYPFDHNVAKGTYNFTLAENETRSIDLRLPGNGQTFTGHVYRDVNGNRKYDAGDTGIANQTLFADYNYNGVIDAGETTVTTDSTGKYTVKTLQKSSAFTLRPTSGLLQDVPINNKPYYFGLVGSELYANGTDFAVIPTTSATTVIRGLVFEDFNADGQLEPQLSLPVYGIKVWADYDNDGVLDTDEPSTITADTPVLSNSNTFSLTVERRSAKIPLRIAPNRPYWVATTPGVSAPLLVDVSANQTLIETVRFGLYSPVDTFAGQFYVDTNRNGRKDGGEASAGAGHRVYIDTNNDRAYQSGEPTAFTDADGRYEVLFDQPVGAMLFRIGAILNTGFQFEGNVTSNSSTYSGGLIGTGNAFHYGIDYPVLRTAVPTDAAVTGIIFADTNRNGKLDTGEMKLVGRSVFADYNYNNRYDAGEPIAITDANGLYSLITRSTNVSVRVVTQNNETISLPGGATSLWIPTINGTVAGKNIGIASTTPPPVNSIVTGTVFTDTNRNGKLDTSETKLAGRTVFADYNYNGRLDAGEASAITDLAGNYSLATRATNVSLRLVIGAGETLSLPNGATSLWLPTVSGTITGRNLGVNAS